MTDTTQSGAPQVGGLTDDHIMEIAKKFSTGSAVLCRSGSIAFARAAIAASQSKEGS